jgi:hypothetical protein
MDLSGEEFEGMAGVVPARRRGLPVNERSFFAALRNWAVIGQRAVRLTHEWSPRKVVHAW